MKKIFALVLAMIMVLSMGVAFADTTDDQPKAWDGTYAATASFTINDQVKKTYNSENNVVVNETLSFDSTPDENNPAPDGQKAPNLTVANLTVNTANDAGWLSITVPSLTKAGRYEWVIKENEGKTPGVTYSKDEVHVVVLVEYNNEKHSLQIHSTESYIKGEEVDQNGKKVTVKKNTFTNAFNSGSFTVAKDVTGNMSNENDEFEINVTLTSANKIGTNVKLAGEIVTPSDWTEVVDSENKVISYTYTTNKMYSEKGGAKTFSDIPVGVVVTVTENTAEEKMNGYDYVSTKVGTEVFTSLMVADDTNSDIVVQNKKEDGGITTGMFLDNAPYMIIMALVLVGAAMMLKRRAYND